MALTGGRRVDSPSTLAQQTLDEEARKKQVKAAKGKKGKANEKATGASIGESAAAGAVAGSVVPGIGTLIGAGVGAAVGAADANKAEKDAASAGPRLKKRRFGKGVEIFQETKQRKEQALATLSQAVFDWAASIR